MDIEFELESKNKVLVKSDGKVIGHIFSPAGTSKDVKNSIQICGFEDAYDLWGCGVFSEKVSTFKPYSKEKIDELEKRLLSDESETMKDIYKGMLKRGGVTENTTHYKKDIQLLFKDYVNVGHDNHQATGCYGCYNKDCSCTSKEKGKPFLTQSSFNEEFKKRLDDTRDVEDQVDNHGQDGEFIKTKIKAEGVPEEIKFSRKENEEKN